ncbi:MAG: LacI family transcriptional regulator, partial [candidate division KSB1 bacterium]|nr:LacI family transcriptional regulator [candidate division KSB1 bacterium]
MSVTIYDVAKKAGVGIGTVSRALNNSPNILPETKAKVLRVVKELNYQPYAMAQRLARKKTNTIAAIIPIFTSYFFLEMLKGIQHEITRHNYDLILYSVDKLSKKDIFLKKTLQERRVDGVLLISLSIDENYVARFLNSRLPIVLVDNFHSELDSITIENTHGAYLATQHLIKLGHTKIAMINGQLHSFPAGLRLEGYKRALTESQI